MPPHIAGSGDPVTSAQRRHRGDRCRKALHHRRRRHARRRDHEVGDTPLAGAEPLRSGSGGKHRGIRLVLGEGRGVRDQAPLKEKSHLELRPRRPSPGEVICSPQGARTGVRRIGYGIAIAAAGAGATSTTIAAAGLWTTCGGSEKARRRPHGQSTSAW